MTRRRYLFAAPALVATLAISGCSSDEATVNDSASTTTVAEDEVSDDAAATSAPADTAESTSDAAAATSEPEAESTTLQASDDSFTISTPAEWADAAEAAGAEATLATRSNEPISDFFNNVVVVTDEPVDDLEAALADTGESLAGEGGTSETMDPIEIDGEQAFGLRVERTQNDVELVQIQRWVEVDDTLYVIVLSASPEGEDAALSDFETILDSWEWQ